MPRGTTHKLEVQKSLPGNPIVQDVRADGKPRHHTYGVPFFNYGMLPRTWAAPAPHKRSANRARRLLAAGGDNDPVDVIELSGRPCRVGEVRAVKVLGGFELIDQGEADYKVLAIDLGSAHAAALASAAELERVMPGTLERLAQWLIHYKTADGKPPNTLRSRRPSGPAVAARVIHDGHENWKELISSRRANPDGFWLGPTHP